MKTVDVGITNYKGLALDSGTHFFGTPVLTPALAKKKFQKEDLFVGQINVADLAPFGLTEKFGKIKMIYIFYDLFAHEYKVFTEKTEGSVVMDDFNKKFDVTGRFTSPLQLIFSEAEGGSETRYGTKMFCDLPEMIKDEFPKYKSGYKAFIVLCPKKLEYFSKGYLLGVERYSIVAVKEKDLEKGDLSDAVTLNC